MQLDLKLVSSDRNKRGEEVSFTPEFDGSYFKLVQTQWVYYLCDLKHLKRLFEAYDASVNAYSDITQMSFNAIKYHQDTKDNEGVSTVTLSEDNIWFQYGSAFHHRFSKLDMIKAIKILEVLNP